MMMIYLGLALPQGSSDLPGDRPESRGGQPSSLLLDLAPDGACHAVTVTSNAVVSYTAVSPLPGISRAVFSLLRFPAGHPGRTLSVILPCGARTFLVKEDTLQDAIIRLT